MRKAQTLVVAASLTLFSLAAQAQQMGRGPVELNRGMYELNRAALIETMRQQNETNSSSSSGGGGSVSVGPTTSYEFNSMAVNNLTQITQTLSGGTSSLDLNIKQTGNGSTQTSTTSGSVSETLNQILQSGAHQQ